MKKKDDTPSTATRVKAFRDRLSSSSYKRVEGYITADEKSRIYAVKSQLGVTTDVAVAGLLRMGLEQFEKTELPGVLSRLETPAPSVMARVGTDSLPMAVIVKLREGGEQPSYVKPRMVIASRIFTAEVDADTLHRLEADPDVESVSLSRPVAPAIAMGVLGSPVGTPVGSAARAAVEAAVTAAITPDLYTAEMETCSLGTPLMTQGFAMLASGAGQQHAVSTDLMSFTNAGASALSVSANACAVNASPVSLNASYGAAAVQDNDNNPIARFFKHRKEMNKNA